MMRFCWNKNDSLWWDDAANAKWVQMTPCWLIAQYRVAGYKLWLYQTVDTPNSFSTFWRLFSTPSLSISSTFRLANQCLTNVFWAPRWMRPTKRTCRWQNCAKSHCWIQRCASRLSSNSSRCWPIRRIWTVRLKKPPSSFFFENSYSLVF